MSEQNLPQVLSTESVYKGKVFELRVDEIREGDVEYKRDIVVHSGSAVIVPMYADGTIALVRQYRHAAGEFLLEVPAGTLEIGEDAMAGAVRELEEEIGVRAAKVERLCEFYVSPGFLTEKMNLYLATELTATKQALEADEILTVERHDLDSLAHMITRGQIRDAKTIVAILLLRQRLTPASVTTLA